VCGGNSIEEVRKIFVVCERTHEGEVRKVFVVCSCEEIGGDQQSVQSGKKLESDPVILTAASLCLDCHERGFMEKCSDVTRALMQSVECWEWVWSVAEKSSQPLGQWYHKPAAMLDDIYLTALAAAVHSLVSGVNRVGAYSQWWVWFS